MRSSATAGFQRMEITPRSLDIHLPSPERFVQLTVLGAATIGTGVCPTGCRGASALVEAVALETEAVAQRYRDGDSWFFRCPRTSQLHTRSWLAEVSHHTAMCPRMSQAQEGRPKIARTMKAFAMKRIGEAHGRGRLK